MTTYGDTTGAEKIVSIDIDKIALIQRQKGTMIGTDFTAIFMVGLPPYQVVETREEVKKRILVARALRAKMAREELEITPMGTGLVT